MSGEVRLSPVSAEAKFDLLTRIAEKQRQAETALNLALGVRLTADVVPEGEPDAHAFTGADQLTTVSPGQDFLVAVTLHNGSKQTLADQRHQARSAFGVDHCRGEDETGDRQCRKGCPRGFSPAGAEECSLYTAVLASR